MSCSRSSRYSLTALVLALAGCGSPTTPTATVPLGDPPSVTCPANQTAQAKSTNPLEVQYPAPTVVGGTAPVAVTCTPASGSLFPIGVTSVACTATDASQRVSSCSLSVKVLPVPLLTAVSILAFGDSVTWGEDGFASATSPVEPPLTQWSRPSVRVPVTETYPEVLRQDLLKRYLLQTPTVENAGKPGEEVADPTTFSRFVQYTSSNRYDVVLIMEGSNDLESRDDRVEPAVLANLERMVDDAKSRGMRPFLATIAPMDRSGWRGLAASLVPGFNDHVRDLATAENVPLVDVYNALVKDVPNFIGADGLHPTPAGYAKIAETFFTSIQQNLETSTTPAPGITTWFVPLAPTSATTKPPARQRESTRAVPGRVR